MPAIKKRYTFRVKFLTLYCLLGFICLNSFGKKYEVRQEFVNSEFSYEKERIKCIAQDYYGFIWYASDKGLVRYDGGSKKFFPATQNLSIQKIAVNFRNELILLSDSRIFLFIPREKRLTPINGFGKDVRVNDLLSYEGNIVFATNRGLFVYGDQLTQFGKSDSLDIRVLAERAKQLFFATASNQVYHFRMEGMKLPERIASLDDKILSLHSRFDDKIWIGTEKKGLYLLNPIKQSVKNYPLANLLDHPFAITCFEEDAMGRLWAGTSGGGLLRIKDKKKEVLFSIYRLDKKRINGTKYNRIHDLLKGASDLLWLGTEGNGLVNLNFFDRSYTTVANLNSSGNVTCVVEDKKGNTWIGSFDNGIQRSSFRDIMSAKKETKEIRIHHYTARNSVMTSNHVTTILETKKSKIWFGTWGGGLYRLNLNLEKDPILKYEHIEGDSTSLASNFILDLHQDKNRKIWISTPNGIQVLDRKTDKFKKIKLPELSNLSSGDEYSFFKILEREKEILFVSKNTICVCNIEDNYSCEYIWTIDKSVQKNLITSVKLDDPVLWLGTNRGLERFHLNSRESRFITDKSNLITNEVKAIEMDEKKNLWLITADQIMEYNTSRAKFYHLDIALGDGVQFNGVTFYQPKTHSKKMYFGTQNGLITFRPDVIRFNRHIPKPVLTTMYLKDREKSGESSERDISLMDTIVLPYQDNSFTLQCAILGFKNKEFNRLAYRLDGLENQWSYRKGQNHLINYEDLPSGTYTLLLEAANSNNIWSKTPTRFVIKVKPPFFLSKLAYAVYFILVSSLIGFIVLFVRNRMVIQAKIKEQAFAMAFFSNLSHDLRTPLSLILGPIQKLKEGESEVKSREYLDLIDRNANRLMHLASMALDFESKSVSYDILQVSYIDITNRIQELVGSFQTYASDCEVELLFKSENKVLGFVDWEKLEIVIVNLLSNAFKYTDAGDHIKVTLKKEGGKLIIQVRDSGVGISENIKSKIFDRYFFVPHKSKQSSKGIGLSIVKKLVGLHKGRIEFESVQNQFTCFTLRLPIEKEDYSPKEIKRSSKSKAVLSGAKQLTGEDDLARVLIIEDSEDLLHFLSSELGEQYRVFTCKNATQVGESIQRIKPDIIISDVQISGMNGFDLCRQIKKDERFAAIPVVLITAYKSEDARFKSLEAGADSFFTKPFDLNLFRATINNLLLTRKRVKEFYQDQKDFIPAAERGKAPEEFVLKVLDIIRDEANNPEFTVSDLAEKMVVSRSFLHGKLKELCDASPGELIRKVRLEHAAQLLKQGEYSVAEVAFLSGFNDPKYFSRSFKMAFGQSPKDYGKAF